MTFRLRNVITEESASEWAKDSAMGLRDIMMERKTGAGKAFVGYNPKIISLLDWECRNVYEMVYGRWVSKAKQYLIELVYNFKIHGGRLTREQHATLIKRIHEGSYISTRICYNEGTPLVFRFNKTTIHNYERQFMRCGFIEFDLMDKSYKPSLRFLDMMIKTGLLWKHEISRPDGEPMRKLEFYETRVYGRKDNRTESEKDVADKNKQEKRKSRDEERGANWFHPRGATAIKNKMLNMQSGYVQSAEPDVVPEPELQEEQEMTEEKNEEVQ